MNQYYPNLFSPIKIGSVTLKNRIVAAPSSQGDVSKDGTLNVYNIGYYARKAKGGAAMVVVGDGIVHPTGQNHPIQVSLYTDACLPTIQRCAEAIHQHDCVASFELSHGGIVCNPDFIGGERPWGPSELPVTIGFQTDHAVKTTSRELTVEMMQELANAFAAAAVRCKKAGFDMVMVHASHGWLLSQFFSPNTNRRTDEYGGSVENRCRFPIMVLKAIRAACGPRFPIEIRLNGGDSLDDGLTLEDAVECAKLLEPYVDGFHISSSVHYIPEHQDVMQSPMFRPRGHLLHRAAAVKAAVSKPVTTVGGYTDPDMLEDIVASGKADIVALGRQLLADPDIAVKAQTGRAAEIRHCLRCGTCQSGRFTMGCVRCALNPEIGREYELQFLPPAEASKKVLIMGGGPAGMQAAITATKRGHKVKLYEKTDKLGGALNFAKYVPFKSDLFALIASMEAEFKALGVEVHMNTELTPEAAEAEKPDAIISAIGADAIRPNFPGIDNENVIMAGDIAGGEKLGKNIVVIGGGLVGCEAALHIAMEDAERSVTILEMAPDIAPDANFRHIRSLKRELAAYNVKLELNKKCRAITDSGVEAEDADGNIILLAADTVIISVGMSPREGSDEAFRYIAPVFRRIGNCVRPDQIKGATRAGFDVGITL